MPFEKNIAALRKMQPKLAALLETVEVSDKVQLFMNSHEEINIAYDNGALHRMEDPMEEAYELFEAAVSEKDRSYQDMIFMYGFGLGYLMQRAFVSSECKLVVYEPHLEVLRRTLEVVDFSQALESRRLVFVVDLDRIVRTIASIYLLGDGFHTIALPAYHAMDPSHYLAVLDEVRSAMMVNLVGQNTALMMLEEFTRTALNNMPEFLKYPDISMMKDTMKGMPGVVVSAGPSLDRPGVIERLREIQDHVVISCVGQAARALEAAGIVPDFVNILEVRDVSQQVAGVSYMKDTNLILLPQANATLYQIEAKRKFVSFSNKDPLTQWMSHALHKSHYGFNHQGTVSISAMLHLMKMGCSTIFLLGQDLAYPEGQMYASNSVYKGCRLVEDGNGKRHIELENKHEFISKVGFAKDEAEWQSNTRKQVARMLETKGWNGEKMLTNPSYDAYRKAFEIIAENNKKEYTIINCSEGGVKMQHMEHLPFVDAVEKYNVTDYNPKPIIEEFLQANYQENAPYSDVFQKVYDQFAKDQEELDQLETLVDEAEELLNKVIKELADKKVLTHSLQSRIRKLSELDEDMSRLTQHNILINAYIKKEMLEFNRTYARKMHMNQDTSQEGDMEALSENLDSSSLLYKAVRKGASGLKRTIAPIFETFPAEKKPLADDRPAGHPGKRSRAKAAR